MAYGCEQCAKVVYTAEEYAEIVDKIRASYGADGDRVAITTDIIAGFAGETEEEHRETIEFMHRIGFARVHVFPYSRRSGTVAASMPGQLTNAEKAAVRTAQLIYSRMGTPVGKAQKR